MERENYSTGTTWEPIVGYSRAVKVRSTIYVSGTTATNKANEIVGDTPYEQTVQCIQNIENALTHFGATLQNVVRTRMFVTNIADWQEIGKAHGEYFKEIRPASLMVEVSRLVDPKMLIEMEVDAVLYE